MSLAGFGIRAEMASRTSESDGEMYEGLVHFIVHLWGKGQPSIPKGALKDHDVHRIELDTSMTHLTIR